MERELRRGGKGMEREWTGVKFLMSSIQSPSSSLIASLTFFDQNKRFCLLFVWLVGYDGFHFDVDGKEICSEEGTGVLSS